jgi:hypothetical protein
LTPVNTLRRSIEFKQAMATLSKQLQACLGSSFTVVIDPPAVSTEETINANLDHLISLVSADLIEALERF